MATVLKRVAATAVVAAIGATMASPAAAHPIRLNAASARYMIAIWERELASSQWDVRCVLTKDRRHIVCRSFRGTLLGSVMTVHCTSRTRVLLVSRQNFTGDVRRATKRVPGMCAVG